MAGRAGYSFKCRKGFTSALAGSYRLCFPCHSVDGRGGIAAGVSPISVGSNGAGKGLASGWGDHYVYLVWAEFFLARRTENKKRLDMRRVRYAVATSLDGYIAGPNGEADWIVHNPEVDFEELFSQFDTALIGRKTFDTMIKARRTSMPGMKVLVFSQTLRQEDFPEVTIVADKAAETVAELRKQSGKDIWLFGGGELFSSLTDNGLVDTVEVALMPVILGKGIPLAHNPVRQLRLMLSSHHLYKTSGIVSLQYAIQ